MSGHRWWALRAGAVSALVAGLLAGSPTPAQAQNADLRLDNIGNVELRVGGGAQNVNLAVENQGEVPAADVELTLTVPLTEIGVHIASAPDECSRSNNDTRMDCTIALVGPGQQWTGVAQIGVHGNSSLQAGESRNGTAEVSLRGGDRQTFNVRVNGPEKAAVVEEVSGVVTDELTGEPIAGATVFLVDSQNGEFSTTTNGDGGYQFAGEDIAPGSIGLRASKEGYQGQDNIQNAAAGQRLTGIQLTLRSTASPTPSASPTPTATATATPTSTVAAPPDDAASGSSFFTKIMITLGILFVLLGLAAIGYLIWRRRRELREDGPDGAAYPTSGPRGPAPRPGSRGVYRPSPTQVIGGAQTQVIGGAHTQVARPGGGPPLPAVGPQAALADAPTMLHRAGAADETAMIPRAGGPPGPRPPVGPGSPPFGPPPGPPPPRSAAPPPPSYGAETYPEPRGRHGGGYGEEPPTYGRQYPENPTQPGAAYGSPAPGGQSYGSPAGPPPAAAPPPPADGYGYDQSSYGSYGPDPYAQPASGDYGQPGDGQPGRGQPGYERPGYERPGDEQAGGYPETGHAGGGRHGAPEQGYAEPGYGPPPRPGYPPSAGPGYGRPGPPASGPPPSGQAPGNAQPGYGDAYGQQGHGEYGQAAGPQDHDADYYDESGVPRPRHGSPGERRRLDWLDD